VLFLYLPIVYPSENKSVRFFVFFPEDFAVPNIVRSELKNVQILCDLMASRFEYGHFTVFLPSESE